MADRARIGWIGTGVMGAPMAGHLLTAGHSVTTHNRTRSKADPLATKGALVVDSPAEVTSRSDVIFTMVGLPQDVRETYFGKNGIFQTARSGQLLVDMTTSSPSLAEELAATAMERGARALDAPVSGGQVGAETARLTIMVGGDKESFERAIPIFQKLGKTITFMGSAGSGQHCKIINQILIAGNMLALAESLTYARKCGIDPRTALDAVSQGAAASWTLTNLGPRILNDDFSAGFFVDHFVKDLGLALAEAKKMKLALPMLALAEQLYVALQANGHGRLGTQAIMKTYQKLNNTN